MSLPRWYYQASHPEVALQKHVRARQLLGLFQMDPSNRQVALELGEHTPHEVQRKFMYPEDLTTSLRRPELLDSLLSSTGSDLCVAGQFFD